MWLLKKKRGVSQTEGWKDGILEGRPGEWPGPAPGLSEDHDKACWRERWKEGREEMLPGVEGCIRHNKLTMETL